MKPCPCASVLDCAPDASGALSTCPDHSRKSARGLAHSKTWRSFDGSWPGSLATSSIPSQQRNLSRRRFLADAAAAASIAALGPLAVPLCRAADQAEPPVAVFSKVYQELKLGFDESAEVTAEAGLDGIDCPVRPGGQVQPERVAEDLPRYAEALQKRNVKVLLLTTAIVSATSPHAEAILRTARKCGVKYYRLGYWNYAKDKPAAAQLNEIKVQLKDLAALNKDLGACAILQNHAGTNIVGAKVSDLYEIARGFDPDQIALAFDIGHAVHELDAQWLAVFQNLRSHFRIAYVKDWKRGAGFVPFGAGELGQSGFFKLLRDANYTAPVSMHTEYEWAGKDTPKSRAGLVNALQRDLKTLQTWLSQV